MTVLLYAVTEANAPIAGTGLDERPLRAISNDGLSAVVSDVDASPVPTEPNLWAYEQVIETLMTQTPVLPARFGANAATDGDVQRMLAKRHQEFRRTLKRVRGAVEIAIRVPSPTAPEGDWPGPDGSSRAGAGSGTDYMLARLAQRQRAGQVAAEVDAAVGSHARARTRRTSSFNTLAYLVDQDQVEEFITRLHQLNDPEITWTGPWPPYSFIEPAGERP